MTPAQITQWLEEPATETDNVTISRLAEAYPYFVPVKYMQAAVRSREEVATPQVLGDMRLYMGNWLLFHQLMQKSATPRPVLSATQAPEKEVTDVPLTVTNSTAHVDIPLIQPVYTEDYFLHQGIVVDDKLPEEIPAHREPEKTEEDPKSLMVVMSFSEWLMHFRSKSQKEKEEEEDRRAVKSMWQKEKLAAALEEENDEIPENVFEMAVNSLNKEEDLASESLAEILNKQGKTEKAIEMYKKLSLRNPQKSAYFAQQIAQLQKNTDL